MAQYDRADLVRRFRRHTKRPATDASLDLESDIYPYLSDAQRYIAGQLAIHVPQANRAVKELMTTADSGLTYSISSNPIGKVDIYYSLTKPDPLTPGEAWQTNADFEWEGLDTIRMIRNTERTDFPDGAPYAHYVPEPDDIDASTEPSIVPAFVRILIPIRAAILYLSEGSFGDPSAMDALYQRHWRGDPLQSGDIGILGELKLRYGEHSRSERPWWRSPDLSDLPIGFNS